jgi:hypothetical protein
MVIVFEYPPAALAIEGISAVAISKIAVKSNGVINASLFFMVALPSFVLRCASVNPV